MKISFVRPLALLALSASLCSTILANPSGPSKPGMGGKMGGPGMGRTGGMRGGMMGRMMKELNLTSAQQAKMKTLMEQRRAIRQNTTLSDDQKRTKMKAMNPKIDAILTPAQRQKRETMMKERMKQWGQGGKRSGGMGGPAMGARMGG